MNVQQTLRFAEPEGNGRALCVLIDSQLLAASCGFKEEIELFCEALCSRTKVYKIYCSTIDYQKVAGSLDELTTFLSEQKVRQAGFITFGASAVLLWKLAISHQKLIRYALVVNGETRPRFSLKEKVSQWLEAKLPLGLPFRVSEGKFHALPFLQRFRFPVVVTTLPGASEDLLEQARLLEYELPVAWAVSTKGEDSLSGQLEAHQLQVSSVPAKCPQKNRVAARAAIHR